MLHPLTCLPVRACLGWGYWLAPAVIPLGFPLSCSLVGSMGALVPMVYQRYLNARTGRVTNAMYVTAVSVFSLLSRSHTPDFPRSCPHTPYFPLSCSLVGSMGAMHWVPMLYQSWLDARAGRVTDAMYATAISVFSLLSGAAIYADGAPERFFPGVFDRVVSATAGCLRLRWVTWPCWCMSFIGR